MKVFVFPGQGTQRAGMLRQLRESYDAVKDIFDTASELENLTRRMSDAITGRMNTENVRIEGLSQKLPSLFAVLRARQEQLLETVWIRSVNGVRNLLTSQTHKLEILDKTLAAADPAVILKRGYSLTRAGGRVVKCASDLKKGDRLTTVFADGSVESEII